MARYNFLENTKVAWVPTIVDTAEPTTAELGGGTELTDYLTRNGLSRPRQGSRIDVSDLGSRQEKTAPGSKGGGAVTLTCYRDDDSDTAWTTLTEDSTGFLVVRDGVDKATPWTDGDSVEVYPVEVLSRGMGDTGDAGATFTAELAVTGEVEQDATVDSGS